MTDDIESRRRRIRRRGAGNFGGRGVSDSTTTHGSSLPNDIEDDPEVADLNEQVVQQANAGRFVPPAAADDFTPQNRMKEVKGRGGKYEREYRLQLLHRMLMRRVPLDQIAQELDVSTQTIMKDRQELFKRLKEEAKRLDINHIIGDTVGFYTEVQGMALRAASSTKNPMNVRLAALRTALSSKNDMHRFFNASGVYDVLRYRASEESDSDDIGKLMEITEKLMSGEDEFSKVSEGLPELPNLVDDEDEEDMDLELRMF